MSVRIDENTDHMKYTDDMEAIDSDIMDRVIAEMNSYGFQYVPQSSLC